jgi:hypothetical protein
MTEHLEEKREQADLREIKAALIITGACGRMPSFGLS